MDETEKLKNGDIVSIAGSREAGRIKAHATYLEGPDNYLVRYVDGTGCSREGWFLASELMKLN